MTEEQNRLESDAAVDSVVTRTYKELAGDLAPEHLDRAILKQATDAVRPRYLRSISWTRPMAWAATITLCVGLVLEVTKAPEPVSTDTLMAPGRLDAPAPSLDVPEPVPGKAEATRVLMEEAQKEAREAPAERKRAAKINANSRQQDAAPPASAEVLSMRDDDVLGRAKEVEALSIDDIGESDQALRSAASSAASPELESPACDETEVATAASWILCIKKLEDAGRTIDAKEQRALYDAAYPAYEPL